MRKKIQKKCKHSGSFQWSLLTRPATQETITIIDKSSFTTNRHFSNHQQLSRCMAFHSKPFPKQLSQKIVCLNEATIFTLMYICIANSLRQAKMGFIVQNTHFPFFKSLISIPQSVYYSRALGFLILLSFTLKWLVNRESTNGIKLSN